MEQPRFEDELIDAHGTKHFTATEIIDAKATQFAQLWHTDTTSDDQIISLVRELKGSAVEEDMPVWTLEDLDRALQGEPDKCRGADKMVMTDARRLPPAGRQALVHLYNRCEAKLGFPRQRMLAIIMLQPKQKGDRALALLT
eukprot:7322975-Pyramimonas_sp.AAC.1